MRTPFSRRLEKVRYVPSLQLRPFSNVLTRTEQGSSRSHVCTHALTHSRLQTFEYDNMDGKAHQTEISKLVYCDEHAICISVSWDRSIAIHDEAEAEEGVLLRRIKNAHKNDITALSYSHNLSLICTGSANSSLKIWDFEFTRLDSELFGHTSAITCIAFLDPFPALVSCDAGGNVLVWATRPSRQKNKLLTRWKNRPKNKGGGRPQAAAVTTLEISWKVKESEAGEVEEEEEEGEIEKRMASSEDAQRWLERLKK